MTPLSLLDRLLMIVLSISENRILPDDMLVPLSANSYMPQGESESREIKEIGGLSS